MSISTDVATYQVSVNVYTMIIDNKAELDQWQEVAADNSVKAGLCVEEQKKAVLSGYFILGDNIEYSDTWTPILAYGNPGIWSTVSNANYIATLREQYKDDATALEKIIEEDWGTGNKSGFRGTFDGDGYYINGLWIEGTYSGFVITGGYGTIKNVAFTNACVSATSAVVANRGHITVENVYVWHKVYGKIEASLNIYSVEQVKEFIEGVRSGKSTELMNITGGYHYHTVRADSEDILDAVETVLMREGFLVDGE
jgi:hypothetical protein